MVIFPWLDTTIQLAVDTVSTGKSRLPNTMGLHDSSGPRFVSPRMLCKYLAQLAQLSQGPISHLLFNYYSIAEAPSARWGQLGGRTNLESALSVKIAPIGVI